MLRKLNKFVLAAGKPNEGTHLLSDAKEIKSNTRKCQRMQYTLVVVKRSCASIRCIGLESYGPRYTRVALDKQLRFFSLLSSCLEL